MSNPSFSNIDRWLFELMEGNLSEEQVAQLESFLIQHPELDVDRDMWEIAKVDNEQVVFPHADRLIRRRPVGLFMSMGMASIAGIIALGTVMYWPTAIEPTRDAATANVETPTIAAKPKTKAIDSETTERGGANEKAIEIGNQPQAALNTPEDQTQEVTEVRGQRGITTIAQQRETTPQGHTNVEFNVVSSSVGQTPVTELAADTGVGRVDEGQQHAQVETTVQKTEASTLLQEVGLTSNTSKGQETNEVVATTTTKSTIKHTVYKETFSSKLRQVGRAVSRMLDNPVALKNLKDPHYHVPGMQPTEVNFGAVGTLLATRVQTMSRLQWAGQPNQQLMNSVSVDGYSYGMRGGLGLVVSHSQYADGGIQNIHSSFTYSPKFSVSRNVIIEPSFRFTMGNKTIDPTKIQTGSMVEMERLNPHQFYTAGQMPIGRSLWYRDLGLGLSVNTRWFYASVQGDNLLKHTDNIYSSDLTDIRRSGQHFIATIGTDYESRKEHFSVSPYVVYQQYETLKEAWLGVNMRYHWITVGAAISSQLDPAVSVGLKFNHFMLAYNADLTHSEVFGKQFLSHQLTLRILTKPSRMGQRLLNL
ncbi:MAG: Type secretion system rane protein PorP/SprF [Bacteroidota bacterium]|jgi:type IX secretion system PorP/SprF family membrane protein